MLKRVVKKVTKSMLFFALLFFSIAFTTGLSAGTVDIQVSGLDQKAGWNAFKTTVTNNSSEVVTSIQFTIPLKYFSMDSTGAVVGPNYIQWEQSPKSFRQGNQSLILTTTLPSAIQPGASQAFDGQFANLALPLPTNDIQTSYNKQVSTVSYILPTGVAQDGLPVVIINGTSYKLSFDTKNDIPLFSGVYQVSIPNICSDMKIWQASGYDSNLTLSADKNQNISFSPVSVPTSNIAFTVLGIPNSTQDIPFASVLNEYGILEKNVQISNGTNNLVLPSSGTFNVTFEGIDPWYTTQPNCLNVYNGQIQGSSAIVYTNKKLLKVGYIGIGSDVSVYTQAVSQGYNIFAVSFFNLDQDIVSISQTYYNPQYTTAEQFKATVASKVKALKAAGVIALLSFGGEGNTFKPGKAVSMDSVAKNMVAYVSDLGADGVDFDLEMLSTSPDIPDNNDFLYDLIVKMKNLKPDIIISAAPQLNVNGDSGIVSAGADGAIYKKAISEGLFNYLFMQLYNTGGYSIGGYNELNTQFIVSSFDWIKNNTPSTTLIVQGEPAAKEGAGDASIYNNGVAKQDVWNGVRESFNSLIKNNDARFGGSMVWSVEVDQANNWGFSNTVFK